MGQDKMAPTWLNLKTFKNIGVFLLGRYPFINAGVLMMVLGERAAKDKNVPPFHLELLYLYLFCMVLLGLGMSYDYKRKHCTLGYVGLLAYMAYNIYINDKLSYNPWLKNRLISRLIGLAGIYIIYAFLTSPKKSRRLQKIGEGCLAVFTMTSMFILVNGAEDREVFIAKIPLQNVSLFFLITVMGACAMIYINGGIFLTDASQAMMCMNLAVCVCIYADVNFWVGKRGVPFWIQIKLIIDDVTICIGLFVMSFANIYWKHRLPKEDLDGNLYQHDGSLYEAQQSKPTQKAAQS